MQLEKKKEQEKKKNVTMAHKNGSLICTVMLIWPFIIILIITLCQWTVSPTTRANSMRATPHSYAIHSLDKAKSTSGSFDLTMYVAWKSVTRVHCFEKLYVWSLNFYTSIVASSTSPSATSTETPSHGDSYIACQVSCEKALWGCDAHCFRYTTPELNRAI